MSQPSTPGLLLSKLHRRACEAATTVRLAHPKFVHPRKAGGTGEREAREVDALIRSVISRRTSAVSYGPS
jgi:hypothetical protein